METYGYKCTLLTDTEVITYIVDYLKEGVFLPPSQFETNFLSVAHGVDIVERIASAYCSALQDC